MKIQGKKRAKAVFTVLLTLILLVSCDSRRVFEQNTEIPEYTWDKANVLKFDAEIQDTLSLHNVYVNIRNGSSYPYSNIFLFITTRAPKGGIIKDTIELTLADVNGKWLGTGLGDIWDNQFPYKMNVKFPYKGTYTFELEQAMRNTKLPFIMDAGIRIERAK